MFSLLLVCLFVWLSGVWSVLKCMASIFRWPALVGLLAFLSAFPNFNFRGLLSLCYCHIFGNEELLACLLFCLLLFVCMSSNEIIQKLVNRFLRTFWWVGDLSMPRHEVIRFWV